MKIDTDTTVIMLKGSLITDNDFSVQYCVGYKNSNKSEVQKLDMK